MPLTVEQTQNEVASRISKWLAMAGVVTLPVSVIAEALRLLDYPVSDPLKPTDADVAQVPDPQLTTFLDAVHYQMLLRFPGLIETGNIEVAAGARVKRDNSKTLTAIESAITRLEQRLAHDGVDTSEATISTGHIDLGFLAQVHHE